MKQPVYLDYNASTPLAPEVITCIRDLMEDSCGNPSSSHAFGRKSRAILEDARSKTANLLGCSETEVIFTGGGTESNNLAILGALSASTGGRKQLVCSAVEHPSVMEVCRYASELGYRLTVLPVDGSGLVDPEDLRSEAGSDTLLVSVMHANNEVGTIQPVEELACISRECGALFHTDAAQSAGKMDITSTGADLVSLAGHKIYGPKGTGALFVRKDTPLKRVTHGAGHEKGLRPGTENVIGLAGFGTACSLAASALPESGEHMREMRNRLHRLIEDGVGSPDVRLNGHPDLRLPNTLSLGFRGTLADRLMRELQDSLAVSAGAACHGEGISLSPVLEAMHVPAEWAAGTLRFSTGRETTLEDVTLAAELITKAVRNMIRERRKECP